MIRLSLSRLRLLALGTLLIPGIIVLFTWVQPVWAIPCVFALTGAFLMYRKSLFDSIHLPVFGKSKEIQLPILTVLACLACAALWTALSGIGGFFYQNDDFYGRNAIFHDLLNYHWPVHFPGTEYALTYYIGYWMVPSLLGKITSYLIGG